MVAGKRIRKVYKQIVTMGRAIERSSPAEDYHELRKKGKELRYLLELFGVKLFDEEAVTPFVKSLKGLQDLLGRHQDREVQIAMLRSSAEEVATLPGGGAACMAMGDAGRAPARRRAGRARRVRRALRRARRQSPARTGSRDFRVSDRIPVHSLTCSGHRRRDRPVSV